MTYTFECPSCGASLDYDGDDDPVVRCAYCDSAVIVPADIRAPQHEQRSAWTATALSTSSLSIDLGGLTGTIANLKAVKQLVREGQKEQAAQLYQEALGASAEEAQAVVEKLASGQSVVLGSGTVSTSIPVAFGTQIEVTSSPEVAEVLREQMDIVRRSQRSITRAVVWIFILVFITVLVIFGLIVFAALR